MIPAEWNDYTNAPGHRLLAEKLHGFIPLLQPEFATIPLVTTDPSG